MRRFAIKTLLADRGKLIIALIGVVFSLVLVNIQGGLFLGMIRKASLLVDNCSADIWIGHRGLENADLPHEIPEAWLDRIRGVEGVESAEPYVVQNAQMTLPTGEYEGVWIIGIDADSMLGGPWTFHEGSIADLRRPNSIAVDELDSWKLGETQVGDIVEINGYRARIVAKTHGILGFLTTPYVFTTLSSAKQYARMPDEYCSYFLVKAQPGQDLLELKKRLAPRVPELDIFTAEQLSFVSRMYWMARTGLGQSFGGATILGLLVGFVMVAQSLYALVLDHIDDFAALKAIGAEDSQVLGVLLVQTMTIASIGAVTGIGASFLLQSLFSTPFVPIEIPTWLACVSVVLVVIICLLSSILPYLRIRRLDPAVVLQG